MKHSPVTLARAALLTKLQPKRGAANASPSPLRVFSLASCWRWRSLRASVHQRGTACVLENSSPHLPHQPAEPLGENFKLTDVFESGRLCIRLRLGFIDLVLEGVESVMVHGGRGLLDHVKKTKRSIDGLKALSFRAVSTAFLGRLNEHTLENRQFLLIRHCAELVQLRLRHCRQPMAARCRRLHGHPA